MIQCTDNNIIKKSDMFAAHCQLFENCLFITAKKQKYCMLTRSAKITHKNRKKLEISCFEMLYGYVLFCELAASSVAWTYFMKA
jgi:hypothetical protein